MAGRDIVVDSRLVDLNEFSPGFADKLEAIDGLEIHEEKRMQG